MLRVVINVSESVIDFFICKKKVLKLTVDKITNFNCKKER